jgi:hypothetical protein
VACWIAAASLPPVRSPGQYHVAVIERVDSRRGIRPGERTTDELPDYLRRGLAAGMHLPDPADPSLGTIR